MKCFRGSVERFRSIKHHFIFPMIVIISIISWIYNDLYSTNQHQKAIYGYASGISHADSCDKWEGAEDVVLVMKTGASEIEAKLPVHLDTTFKCAPNVLVFSDMAQQFKETMVKDPLRHLVGELNEEDPNLRYYLNLIERQSKGEDFVKGNNTQAWKLDRYKNVPMLQQAYDAHPHAKWFFFIDADTALLWPNLLIWLSQMDPSKPHYISSSIINRDNIRFAYGGTGYIISHAAAKLVAEETKKVQKKSFEITKKDCCGDSTLAKVLRLHNVLITSAAPNVNGETLFHLSYAKESLCFALVTMHHMNANELATLVSYQNRLFNGKVSQIHFRVKLTD